MPACGEKESNLQNGGSQGGGGGLRSNFHMLTLDLSLISRNMSSFMMGEVEYVNWGAPANDAVGHRVYDKTEDDDINSGDEDFSVFNYTDDDDDAQSLIRCPFCEFELAFPATRSHSEEAGTCDPTNMVCPLCDEKVGEDATGKLISIKNLKSEKSSISSGDSPMLDKKLAAGGSQHKPMADSFLLPFICDTSGRNPSGVHPGEDSTSNASYISNEKSCVTGAPDTGNEQDHAERRLRASVVQQLVLSTLF